ncbi:unnamed protein product, partial [Mesorhabditis spiculigera]
MRLPFGYAYDERMLEHVCNYDPTMAERPERMKIIHERLEKERLLRNIYWVQSREAVEDELLLNHPIEIIREMNALDTDEACENFCKSHEILWMNPKSEQAARIAVGNCIEMLKAHHDKRVGNGFAVVRPPGHHAYGKSPMGYCVYNNVAITAKYAVEKLGYKRVSIIDFDYHPANGTYYSVKDDPRIMLVSFHSYHRGLFWPYSRDFDYNTKDNSMFFPLNCNMNTESDYLAAFNHVIMPVLKEWDTDLVLVSAGFDAGYYDIMLTLGQAIKAHGYGHIARLLDAAFPDRVLGILEGGYFSECYSESAYQFTRGLQGLEIPEVTHDARVNGSMAEVIWNNIVHHSPRWKSLQAWQDKLQAQQKSLGLEPYTPDNQLYLGHEVKELWNKVVSSGLCRTREWFPEMTPESVDLCTSKINEVKQNYKYAQAITQPSEEQLLKQLVWDQKAMLECHTKSLPSLEFWTDQYQAFKDGRLDHMMVCDWDLIRKSGIKFF